MVMAAYRCLSVQICHVLLIITEKYFVVAAEVGITNGEVIYSKILFLPIQLFLIYKVFRRWK